MLLIRRMCDRPLQTPQVEKVVEKVVYCERPTIAAVPDHVSNGSNSHANRDQVGLGLALVRNPKVRSPHIIYNLFFPRPQLSTPFPEFTTAWPKHRPQLSAPFSVPGSRPP